MRIIIDRPEVTHMNVYDWDNTIYRGDSTFGFVRWLYIHRPKTLLSIPRTAFFGLLYGVKAVKKLTFRETLKIFGRLFGIMWKRYHWLILLASAAILISAASGVVGNLFIGRILVDQEINGILAGTKTFDNLATAIFIMIKP